MTWIIKTLNFTIDLDELHRYHQFLTENHENLKWTFEKCKQDLTEEWYNKIISNPGAEKGYGWALQSNLVEEDIPCTPYNVSTRDRLTYYRNTKMITGIVSRLQDRIPYAQRWSLFIQPPGGHVPLHTDQEDEYTIHIPLQWEKETVFEFVSNNVIKSITMPATGKSYILDTTIPHATYNRSSKDRIGLIFRINHSHLNDLISVTGLI